MSVTHFPDAPAVTAQRSGFCHTPEQDRLYALGYPQMAWLVDDHKDDKKPVAAVAKAFKNYWGPYHVAWPRLVAAAFVRGSAVVKSDWGDAMVAKAASATGPVTAEEAASIVSAHLERKIRGNWNETRHVVFALEAVAGTDVVLEAIVAGLENLTELRWPNANGEDGVAALLAYTSGFLLLRSKQAKSFRIRLEALFEAAGKAEIADSEHTIRGCLDLALHGTAGAARALATSHWQYWYYYLMVDDPTVHIARLNNKLKSDWNPEARILYLAGAEMLPIYTTPKALRMGKQLPAFLHDIGMFNHDRVFELMVSMIGFKGAADAPSTYFRDNADAVRPRLERLARGSSANAMKAQAALTITR